MRIDAVYLGGGAAAIHTWWMCPRCGWWAHINVSGKQLRHRGNCPRCGDGAITDSRDERHREVYSAVAA